MVETRSSKRQRQTIKNTPRLSPDLWMQVAGFLSRKDFNNLKYACKEIHQASKSPSVVPMWPENARLCLPESPFNLSFSADGKMLAAICSDHRLHIWDVRHGKVHGFNGNERSIRYDYILKFSPDGRFMAATTSHGTGIHIFTNQEVSQGGGQNTFGGFDPNEYQFIPTPESVYSFGEISWMSDSKSFVTMGWGNTEEDGDRRLRLKFECGSDGHFAQSGTLSIDLLCERLDRQHGNHIELAFALMSIFQSPLFAELCGPRCFTVEDELDFLDQIESLCGFDNGVDQNGERKELATIFESNKNPAIFYVQTFQGTVFALEVYRDATMTQPSLRVVAQTPTFVYDPLRRLNQTGMEVPGTNIVAFRSYDQHRDVYDIELFELDVQKGSLERVTRSCNALRLVETARQNGLVLSRDYHLKMFTFSPDGKSLVVNEYSRQGRTQNRTRIFSV